MIDDMKKTKHDSKPKKEYTPPKFNRFGSIAELTSGGTGTASETAGGQSSRRP